MMISVSSGDCGVLWCLETKPFHRHYDTLNPRLACSDNARQDQGLSDAIRAESYLAMKSGSEIRAPRLDSKIIPSPNSTHSRVLMTN